MTEGQYHRANLIARARERFGERPEPMLDCDINDLLESTSHARTLLVKLQYARDEERARIAGELHDFTMQQLTAALLHLDTAEALDLVNAPKGIGRQVAQAQRLVRSAVDSLRRIMVGLQPIELTGVTLADAVGDLVSGLQATYGVPIDASLDLPVEPRPEIKMTIYRLLSEALGNACRHALATSIVVVLHTHNGTATAEVHDDGRGLESPIRKREHPVAGMGMGMHLMFEQVLALGGQYEVRSAPGAGTSIFFGLPLNSESAAR